MPGCTCSLTVSSKKLPLNAAGLTEIELEARQAIARSRGGLILAAPLRAQASVFTSCKMRPQWLGNALGPAHVGGMTISCIEGDHKSHLIFWIACMMNQNGRSCIDQVKYVNLNSAGSLFA